VSWADLGPHEQDAFLQLLGQPSLWAFAVVAGQIGTDQAIGVLDQEVTPEVLAVLRAGGWGPHHLPRRHTIDALLRAVQINTRLKRDSKASLRGVAEELGMTLGDAHAVLRVLAGYAGAKALVELR
jgi:hypothetical protein